jgi:hypothetical protein
MNSPNPSGSKTQTHATRAYDPRVESLAGALDQRFSEIREEIAELKERTTSQVPPQSEQETAESSRCNRSCPNCRQLAALMIQMDSIERSISQMLPYLTRASSALEKQSKLLKGK